MSTLIDGARTWLETLAVRPDPERLARTRNVLEDARAALRRRMHQHGIQH